MSKESQLFAPIVVDDAGNPYADFPPGHPGHGDEAYRAHRSAVAAAAVHHVPGTPAPEIAYTAEDHQCWMRIRHVLAPLHRKYAAGEVLMALEDLQLPMNHVPQLGEASRRLAALTGFTFAPAAGIVPLRRFYGTLADSTFQSTQFIRHHSHPLFSPEPDMVHEVLGHGATLASPRFAELYRQVGAAALRAETRESLKALSRVFWYTIEYGLVEEAGEPMVYGASLLSAYGELAAYREVEIRPLDLGRMVTQPYDVTVFQPVLFAARSMNELEDFLGDFLPTVDGDTGARLGVTADQRW
ncbi:phenylalanine 4-monooxygenase [Kitasatospora sp. NPDC094011]|uniref:phenylalanine 4-monooxygenase n=1 Tax=Kitasatospora sp. NPDC094011 TaxID=3364090 RepID=UPI0037F440BF